MATLAYSGRIAPTVQPALLQGARLRWSAGLPVAAVAQSGVLSANARYWGGGVWLGNSQPAPAVQPGVRLGLGLRWGVGGAVIQAAAPPAAPNPVSPWGGALSLSGVAEADGSAWSGAEVWVFADPLTTVTVAADGTFSAPGAKPGQSYHLALVDLLFERIESAIVLVARLLDVEEAWVRELSLDDLSVLLAEAWGANENFFVQALMPIMQGWPKPLASVGTTGSSASLSEVTDDPSSPSTSTTISGDSWNPSPDPSDDAPDSSSI